MSGNMTKGKFQAVVIIIVALLIIAVVCSWLINRDAKKVDTTVEDDSARVSINAADGTNYSSETATPVSESQGTSYTGTATTGTTTTNTNTNTNTNNGTGNASTTVAPAPDVGTVSTPAGTVANTPVPEDNNQTVIGENDPEPVTYTPTPTVIEGTTTVGAGDTAAGYGQKLGSETYYSNISDVLILSANVSAETLNATQVKVTVVISINSESFNTIASTAHIAVNGVFTSVPSNAINYTDNTRMSHELATQTFVVDVCDGSSISIPVDVSWVWNGYYSGQYIDTFECGGSFTIIRA